MGNLFTKRFWKKRIDPSVVIGCDAFGERDVSHILKQMKLHEKWSEQRVAKVDVLAPLGRLKDSRSARLEAKEVLAELRQYKIISSNEGETTGGQSWTLTVVNSQAADRPRSRSMSRCMSRLSRVSTGVRSCSGSPKTPSLRSTDKGEEAERRRQQSLSRIKAKGEEIKRKREEARKRREIADLKHRERSRARVETKQETAARRRAEINQEQRGKVEESSRQAEETRQRKEKKNVKHQERTKMKLEEKQDAAEIRKAKLDLRQLLKTENSNKHADSICKKKASLEMPKERATQELHRKQEQAAIRRAQRKELKARKAHAKQERAKKIMQRKQEAQMLAAFQKSQEDKTKNMEGQINAVNPVKKSEPPVVVAEIQTPSKDEKVDLDDNFWLSKEEKKLKHEKIMRAKSVSFAVDTKPAEMITDVKTAWEPQVEDGINSPKYAWEAVKGDNEDSVLPDWLRPKVKGARAADKEIFKRPPSPRPVSMTPVFPFTSEDTPCLGIGAMMPAIEEVSPRVVEQTPVEKFGDVWIQGSAIPPGTPKQEMPEPGLGPKIMEGVPFEVEALHTTKNIPLKKTVNETKSDAHSRGKRRKSFWSSLKKFFKMK